MVKGKKSSAFDVIIIFIFMFVAGLILFIGHFFTNSILDNMLHNPTLNASEASRDSMQEVKDVTQKYDLMGIAFFIGLFLAVIVAGYFVGGYAIFMAGYFILVVIAVILSAIMANVWESIVTQSVFGATITSLPMTNHIISNFPFYIAIVGMIGIIAMFAKPQTQGY